jgi:hypothetical protein
LGDYKNIKKFYNLPIQIFASDPSFKYYFAYTLNKEQAVIKRRSFLRHLGKALKIAPKKNNPKEITQLTKHLYKTVMFLANKRLDQYIQPKYKINSTQLEKLLKENEL